MSCIIIILQLIVTSDNKIFESIRQVSKASKNMPELPQSSLSSFQSTKVALESSSSYGYTNIFEYYTDDCSSDPALVIGYANNVCIPSSSYSTKYACSGELKYIRKHRDILNLSEQVEIPVTFSFFINCFEYSSPSAENFHTSNYLYCFDKCSCYISEICAIYTL